MKCIECALTLDTCTSDENDVVYGKGNDILECKKFRPVKPAPPAVIKKELRMSKKEAKALSLEMWQYLASHPSCRSKEETQWWHVLKDLKHNCPLCAAVNCPDCPIELRGCELYKRWLKGTAQESNWAAREILGRITEWQV